MIAALRLSSLVVAPPVPGPDARRAPAPRPLRSARGGSERAGRADAPGARSAAAPVAAARARRARCLLIDPDATRRRGILKYLATYALEARGAGSPRVMRAWMERERFDAVILHDAFPDTQGKVLLRWLRKSWAGPILLVARLDESAKIVALETGASDVVDEACSRRELVARVRALLRLQPAGTAAAPPAPTAIRFHDLSLDLVYRRLSNDDRGVALRMSEPEFRLLCSLLLADGRVLGRAALATSVYEGQEAVDARTIDVAVSRLRRAIRSISGIRDMLVTVRGEGYRIVAPDEASA
jgi:two-component system, OmpR family, response regulator